jgi:hypothetical protein
MVMRAIASVATDDWDPASIRIDQQNDQDVGLILEVDTGQCLEWKDIAECSPMYKGYCTNGSPSQ